MRSRPARACCADGAERRRRPRADDPYPREPAARAARRAAGAVRAGRGPPLHRAVAAELRRRHELLSAGLLHDEVQPQGRASGSPRTRASRTCTRCCRSCRRGGMLAQGALEVLYEMDRLLREITGMAALHAAAAGRRARRTDRHDDHGRLPPRQGQQEDHRPRSPTPPTAPTPPAPPSPATRS